MPRTRKTPIADLPAITQAERDAETAKAIAQVTTQRRAPNADKFPEAYETTGKSIETVKVERFGPGADYPSNTISTRYYDADTGRTLQFHWSDATIDAIETFCEMLEERGYVPCQSPDAPKSRAVSVSADTGDALDEDKRIGRNRRSAEYRQRDDEEGATPAQRKFMRQLRIAEYDDPDLTKREASEMIEEKTARARPRGRY